VASPPARDRESRGEGGAAPDPATPEAITQNTAIADADRLLSIEPVVVGGAASLRDIAERAVENPGCRVIAVVDGDERLTGVIPVRVLVNDIFLKILPELFLGEIIDLDAALKYAEHLGARKASDIALPPVSVRADETVRDAFGRMHESRLNGLPIVDAEARVVGYVDQLELLIVWVRATGREGLLEPPDHVHDHR
jgi:CBS domain-containing protein